MSDNSTTCLVSDLPEIPHYSFRIIRDFMIDAASGDGDDADAALLGAKAELSYHLFDGEEFPGLRFRGLELGNDGTYAVTVDIAATSDMTDEQRKAFLEKKLAAAARDNMKSFEPAPPADTDCEVVVFSGSGRGAGGWVERRDPNADMPAP